MAQTKSDWPLSFPLSAKNWAKRKEQSENRSAQSLASWRRSGCSPAEPYPPHECHESTILAYPPFAKGTFLLCRTGDISTLH
jgi:hypothetical protein